MLTKIKPYLGLLVATAVVRNILIKDHSLSEEDKIPDPVSSGDRGREQGRE